MAPRRNKAPALARQPPRTEQRQPIPGRITRPNNTTTRLNNNTSIIHVTNNNNTTRLNNTIIRLNTTPHLRGRSPLVVFPPIPREISSLIRPSHVVTNTELFHLSSLLDPRPRRTRSQSAPPAIHHANSRLPCHRSPTSSPSLLSHLRHALTSTTRHLRRHPLRTFLTFLTAFPLYNLTSFAFQSPPPALTAFTHLYAPHPPTWLYADSPDQMLGLDAPLWDRHIQPSSVMKSVFRKNTLVWGADSRLKHRDQYTGVLPPREQWEGIARRMQGARETFYERAPYGQGSRMDVDVGDDGLPRFEQGCVCNLTRAVSEIVNHAVTPAWKHYIPQELEEYCPCSLASAVGRWWRVLTTDSLPPAVSTYYDGSPWLLHTWKFGTMPFRDESCLTDGELEKARQNGWLNGVVEERKEVVGGWFEEEDEYIL